MGWTQHFISYRLYFSIVSEPVDGDVCEDVGVACVDFVKVGNAWNLSWAWLLLNAFMFSACNVS